MKCNYAKKFLSAYIDDMLDQPARDNLEKHLNSCSRCTEELLMIKKYISEVGSLRQVKAPDNFVGKVKERINRRVEFEKIMRTLFIPARIKVPLETAGLVLAVVLVVITYRIIDPGINSYPAKVQSLKIREKSAGAEILSPSPLEQYGNKEMQQEGYEPYFQKEEAVTRSVPSIKMEEPIVSQQQDSQGVFSEQEVSLQQESLTQKNEEMIAMRTAIQSDSAVKKSRPLAIVGAGKFYDVFIQIIEKDSTLDDQSFKVNRIAKSEAATVVFVKTARDGQSRVVLLSVLAKNYDSLLNKMKWVGKIQYQPLTLTTDSNELLNLRIHLILAQ